MMEVGSGVRKGEPFKRDHRDRKEVGDPGDLWDGRRPIGGVPLGKKKFSEFTDNRKAPFPLERDRPKTGRGKRQGLPALPRRQKRALLLRGFQRGACVREGKGGPARMNLPEHAKSPLIKETSNSSCGLPRERKLLRESTP